MTRHEPRPFATLGLLLLVGLAVAGCAQSPQESVNNSLNNSTRSAFANQSESSPIVSVVPGNNSTLGPGSMTLATP